MGNLNLEKYWVDRSVGYKEEFNKHNFFLNRYFKLQEEILLNLLKTEIDFNSVLEVGCGFGRITKLITEEFPKVERITAIDISPAQIENAKKYVNNDKVKFLCGKIQDLNIHSENYDLVLASEVLMHINFTDICPVIEQLVRISKKNIINLDWYRQTSGIESLGYCFAHDYESLYKKYGCKVDVVDIPRQSIYDLSFGLDSGLSIKKTYPEVQRIWHATNT
jgi:SAM-dependent methyltransferase